MIFIFLLALVLFGPKKMPELGRQLGKALAEFKKASNEFKNQLETEMLNIDLEEKAKQAPPPDNQPKILPAEKLFDTVSVPPFESIPRAPLPLPDPPSLAAAPPENGTATAEVASEHPQPPPALSSLSVPPLEHATAIAELTPERPQTPEAPGPNA